MARYTTVVVPEDVLDILKCDNCGLLLSVPPVSNTHEGNLECGRCARQATQLCRATAFERVATLLLFPCRYVNEGCLEKALPWGSVAGHENVCSYRPSPCPSRQQTMCEWEGKTKNFVAHFLENHPDLILTNKSINLNLNISASMVALLKVKKSVFIMQFSIDINQDEISVKAYHVNQTSDSENLFYSIELSDAQLNSSLVFHSQVSPYGKLTKTNQEIKASVRSVVSVLLSRDILCHITFVGIKDNTPVTAATPKLSTVGLITDPTVSKDLVCPRCSSYMLPPIFICINGHSVCRKCKVSKCAVCNHSIGNARNFTLEKLAAVLTYRCENLKSGCSFTGNLAAMEGHKNACPAKSAPCPLKTHFDCQWIGLLNSHPQHVRSAHESRAWVLSGQFFEHDLRSTSLKSVSVMSFGEQTFKICCKHSESLTGPVRWVFEHVGLSPLQVSPYTFRVEFPYPNGSGAVRFSIDSPCYGATDDENNFQNCLSIPYHLLSRSIRDNKMLILRYVLLKM